MDEDIFNLGGMPENMLVEILLRLPAKAAFQFKSVSKLWYSLISSTYFVHRRLNNNNNNNNNNKKMPPFLLSHTFTGHHEVAINHYNLFRTQTFNSSNQCYGSSLVLSLAFIGRNPPDWGHPLPVASHRDLLLCRYLTPDTFDIVFALCNPSTKESVDLPPLPYPSVTPLRIPQVFFYGVFIYDISDNLNTFRGHVVLVQFPYEKELPEVNLYVWSPSVRRVLPWRKVHVRCPRPVCHGYSTQMDGVPCGNSLYWLWEEFIFAYDEKGQWYFIDLPLDYIQYRKYPSNRLGVCQGRLRLSQLLFKDSEEVVQVAETNLRIWEYEFDESRWRLEHKVYFRELDSKKCDELSKIVEAGCESLALIMMMGFHLYNPDLVFFKTIKLVAICNVRSKRLRLLSKIVPTPNGFTPTDSILPLMQLDWPTPICFLNP